MADKEMEAKSGDERTRCEKFRAWLGGPTCLIYVNYFCSQWGDRMWLFASALYLVHLDGGMLRLAAALGFAGGGCVMLFGGLVGELVDRYPRLHVVRVALFVQNTAVMLCAVTVGLALHYETSETEMWLKGLKTVFEILIVLFAIVAQLSSVGYKISIEKDWIVVVAGNDKSLLANMNATTRTLDLFAKILAPMFVGFVMSYASLMVSAICIAVWNLLSVWVEFGLLYRIYLLVPEIQTKTLRTRAAGLPDPKETEAIQESADSVEKIPNGDKHDENDDKEALETEPLRQDREHVPEESDSPAEKEKRGCMKTLFEPFIVLIQGWKTYARQKVVYAGLSLAMLYMTVMGFDSVTTGYIYSNNVPEYAVGISMALAGGAGITGALVFTYLRKRNGLERTGLVAFNMEILCLVLAVASVWAPGSPFDLFYASKTPINCTNVANSSSVLPSPLSIYNTSQSPGNLSQSSGNLSLSRTKRDIAGWSILGDHQSELDLISLKQNFYLSMIHEAPSARALRVKRDSFEEVPTGPDDYAVLSQDPADYKNTSCDKLDGVNISIILFLMGIILSRIGLWMADLVVNQLLQENVIDTERGVVNGVQNSMNMLLDMLKFVLVIVAPRIETFGMLIILSFVFICIAGILFAIHSYRVRGHLFHFEKCLCNNNNLPHKAADVELKGKPDKLDDMVLNV